MRQGEVGWDWMAWGLAGRGGEGGWRDVGQGEVGMPASVEAGRDRVGWDGMA